MPPSGACRWLYRFVTFPLLRFKVVVGFFQPDQLPKLTAEDMVRSPVLGAVKILRRGLCEPSGQRRKEC